LVNPANILRAGLDLTFSVYVIRCLCFKLWMGWVSVGFTEYELEGGGSPIRM